MSVALRRLLKGFEQFRNARALFEQSDQSGSAATGSEVGSKRLESPLN